VPVAMPVEADWLQTVLFERGYLARIKGEAIKVYLAMVEAGGGRPDRSVSLGLAGLRRRTRLSTPTLVESLRRLEALGLVVPTTKGQGRLTTYYIADPPAANSS